MGNQGVDEVCRVEAEQNQGDADRQLLVAGRQVSGMGDAAVRQVEDGGQQERDQHDDEQARQLAGALALEGLARPAGTADDHREPETEQARADDRAGELGTHDLRLAGRQDEQREDEFGEAAEADVEQAADGRADVFGDLLGGPAHPVRQHGNGHRAGKEHGDLRDTDDVVQDGSNRDDDEEDQRQPEPPDRRGRRICS